jgi:hypothetical protein
VLSESRWDDRRSQNTRDSIVMSIQSNIGRGRSLMGSMVRRAKRTASNLAEAVVHRFRTGAAKTSGTPATMQGDDAITKNVEQTSEDSFPASDPPAWTSTGVKHG